jgi:hypothetical protein
MVFHQQGWICQSGSITVMSSKSSLLLFAFGWCLLAVATLPVQASAATSEAGVTPATAVTETFPLLDNQITIRQAHIVWLASKEETGMQDTMRYLSAINASIGQLSSLNREFRMNEDAIRNASTPEQVESGLVALCSITSLFRAETDARMERRGKNTTELREQVQSAIAEDYEVRSLEDQYWETRSGTGLSDFDQWIQRTDRTLTQLRENGYEVTAAQEKLTEIIAMRSELADALRARDDDAIEQARETIHAASVDYATTVRMMKQHSTEREQMEMLINQSQGVLIRSGMMNAELNARGINCTQVQVLVDTGQYQISTAQAQLLSGNTTGAGTTLSRFKDTIRSLRDAYRSILIREDLPQTTAKSVLSVAQSMDLMSVRMSGI